MACPTMHESTLPIPPGSDPSSATGDQLTIAAWYALARISAWGLCAWQPKSHTRGALAILDDPQRSSLNSRVVNVLLESGMLQEAGDTLTVTVSGADALRDRPDVMARMRRAGVV